MKKPGAAQVALLGIFTGISYFDRLQNSRHQKSYFLPSGMEINYPYGKPYHFWMAAGLAYFTHRTGSPEITSAFASYTLGGAYETLMSPNGRNYDKILEFPPFHLSSIKNDRIFF